MDVVICMGPNDLQQVSVCVESCRKFLIHIQNIYVITKKEYQALLPSNVRFIDEENSYFSWASVSQTLHTTKRAGWYLQQLLKIYAPRLITELAECYLIVDCDVQFQKPIQFFVDDKIQFNVGTEHHVPQFSHMHKVHPILKKVTPKQSGICHVMPMKQTIATNFMKDVEAHHQQSFVDVFLKSVDTKQVEGSGASEQEMLFSYTLQKQPLECNVRPLNWKNVNRQNEDPSKDYVACHWQSRS